MSFEVREATGALFPAAGKKGDQPDCRGDIRIAGVLYRLAGWWRESKAGTRYLSLKATKADEKPAEPAKLASAPAPAPKAQELEFDDDIPF